LQYQAIPLFTDTIMVADGKNEKDQERGGSNEAIKRIACHSCFHLAAPAGV
jgi:hypothetical protein